MNPPEVASRASEQLVLAQQAGCQTRVMRQAKDIVDSVVLAPDHRRLAGQARVDAEHDLHRWPASAAAALRAATAPPIVARS